jgi:hypothetical protein
MAFLFLLVAQCLQWGGFFFLLLRFRVVMTMHVILGTQSSLVHVQCVFWYALTVQI